MPNSYSTVPQNILKSEIEENRLIFRSMQDVFLRLFSPERCDARREDFEFLDRERANWLRAIRLSEWENASRLAMGLFEYLQARGLWQEIEEIWIDLIHNSPNDKTYERHKTGLLHQLGIIFINQGRLDEAQRVLDQCLELAISAGWTQIEANTLYQLAVSYRHLGEYQRSRRLLLQASEVAQRTADHRRLDQYIQGQLTYVLVAEGKLDEAAAILEKSVVQWQSFEDVSDRMTVHTTLHTLGIIRLQQGRYSDAKNSLEESLNLKIRLDSGAHLISHTKCLLAEAYIALGKYPEAESHLIESIRTCSSIGDGEYSAIARKTLGILRYKQHQYKEAEAIFALAIVEAKWLGDPKIRFETAIWHMRASIRSGRLRGIFNDILIAFQSALETQFSRI